MTQAGSGDTTGPPAQTLGLGSAGSPWNCCLLGFSMDQETSREWHFIPTPGGPKMDDRAVPRWAGCVPG